MRAGLLCSAAALAGIMALSDGALAGPWAEIGDASLRSDVELLASAGVVDNITTQWPLPWAGLMDRLNDTGALAGQPDYVRAIADRLRNRGNAETAAGLHASVFFDGTGSPATVRGYDALGRQTLQGDAELEYVLSTTVLHLNVGARSTTRSDHQVLDLDGSYIAQRLGGVVVYAGYMPHWWGPGWMSALGLSTNARPVPQIGFSRVSTAPFESSWLRWIGPWQFEFFAGVLDGPRVARNTIYDGTRITVSPLPGLEIAAARTDMMCGSGHVCKPLSGYFNANNDSRHNDDVNDEATIDIRYTNAFHQLHFAAYLQLMNEDTNMFHYSETSHLYGATIWHPILGGIGRLTAEYTDSTPTENLFGGPANHGLSYNNSEYTDGMRYRGHTLGFSLDSDSRLMSLQAAYTDLADRTYTLTYHRVRISDPLNNRPNVVTTAPVSFNALQGRVSFPLELSERKVHFDIEGRVQDDQPRPDKGRLATVEAALRFSL